MTDSKNLLTWDAAMNENDKMRFLSPVEVYPPTAASGSKGSPVAPPKDYAGYVMSLSKSGVDITNVKQVNVGGRAATLMTLTMSGAGLNGAIGCPEHGGDPDHDCFGPQPEYTLRLAVLKSGPPLAIWAKSDSDNLDEAFLTSFEQMLGTLRFR